MALEVQNRALLSAEQQGELAAYERMFSSAGWQLASERLKTVFDGLGKQYDAAVGDQALGRIQGARDAFWRVLNLPTIIEAEFNMLGGQTQEATEPEWPEVGDDQA